LAAANPAALFFLPTVEFGELLFQGLYFRQLIGLNRLHDALRHPWYVGGVKREKSRLLPQDIAVVYWPSTSAWVLKSEAAAKQ
jgi:hypothetical protein